MRIVKFLVIGFVFSILFPEFIFASKITFESSENSSYVFKYSNSYSDRNSTSNFFIKELARHNLSGLYSTNYTFYYSVKQSIKKIDENTYEAEAIISGQKCTGDIFYKEFNISDILFPDKADFKIYVNDDGNYIVNREFSEITRDSGLEFKVRFEFETFEENKELDLVLEDVNFYSADTDRLSFQERIGYIDDYYAAIAAIKGAKEALDNIDYSPSNIPDILLQIHESQRIYNVINHSMFQYKLNLADYEEDGFYYEMNSFYEKINLIKFHYNKLTITIDYIQFAKSLPEFANDHVKYINEFIELSNSTKHAYQPYFYKLGNAKYSHSELFDMKKNISHILRKSKFCNDSDIIFDRFKSEVFKAYLKKSEKLLAEENFHLAKGVIENAQRFYLSALGKQFPAELNILMSKANYGIYNSYLHLIDRAIDIGNYGLAENYIEKAKIFQEKNRATIISKKQILTASEELVNLYINKGFRQIQSDEFEEAIYCFEQAHVVCNNIGVYNHDYVIKHGMIQSRNGLYLHLVNKAEEELQAGNKDIAQNSIKKASEIALLYPAQIHPFENFDKLSAELNYQKYLNEISDGKKLLASGNYTMAYHKFLTALQIEEYSSFAIYDPLVDLFVEAATPYLVGQCKLGDIKVKKNQLDEAKAIYDYSFQLQSDYGLYFEPNLMASLTMLNNNIFTKKCENINVEYNALLDQFNNIVESGDFIRAMNVLDQTNDLSKDNYYCELDKAIVIHNRELYQPAATYQELAGEAQKALSEQNQKRFNEIYEQMEELSGTYEVIRKRIEPMPLHYLFSVKKNLALLESTINKYQSEEDYATAFRILNVLESNNTSLKDAKPIQQKLAQKLAYSDKINNSSSNPKSNVEKYTGGNTWYKHFKKEYIKEW
ncbi:MAG: hypothetical protein K8S16_15560 [Bacteroidales bacterium]|nr:hypothetical protein [Bacteroidales bacterium]